MTADAGYRDKTITKNEILEVHNKYREEVGVSPIVWDDQLAASAQQWADHLNAINRSEHSGPGENIAWGFSSWSDAVNSWAAEKMCFKNGVFPDTYNGMCGACTAHNWQCSGHYSQIVWRGTQKVGCGTSGIYRVCQYSPPGNTYGQKAY